MFNRRTIDQHLRVTSDVMLHAVAGGVHLDLEQAIFESGARCQKSPVFQGTVVEFWVSGSSFAFVVHDESARKRSVRNKCDQRRRCYRKKQNWTNFPAADARIDEMPASNPDQDVS